MVCSYYFPFLFSVSFISIRAITPHPVYIEGGHCSAVTALREELLVWELMFSAI